MSGKPEDGEMNEMTLPYGHRIRALVVQAQVRYLSVKEVPHSIESLPVSEEAISCFFETRMSEPGTKPAISDFPSYTRPPAII